MADSSMEDDALSNWDPMKSAYEQKAFNSYQEPKYNTDMKERHQPVRGTRISPAKGNTNEVKLYVSNIPVSLMEDGLKNMFLRFGHCKVVKCKPKTSDASTTFGFVTYNSVKEAETAISELHGFTFGDNLLLNVRLARDYAAEDNFNNVIYRSVQKETYDASDKEDLTTERNVEKDLSRQTSQNSASSTCSTPPNLINGPRLFIHGLPTNCTEKALEAILHPYAQSFHHLIVPPKTKTQKTTYGFATFKDVEDANNVIEELHNSIIKGSKMEISFTHKSAKDLNIKTEEDDYYMKLYGELDTSFTKAEMNVTEIPNGNNNTGTPNSDQQLDLKLKTSMKPTCDDAIYGMMLSDLSTKPFPDNTRFTVCVTEITSPHLFYGQLMADECLQALGNLSKQLQDKYEGTDLPMFAPKLNEVCVAKFDDDGCWYRASVIQYNNDLTARVYFVDFGNKSDVDTSNIRCITEDLLTYPCFALKFKLFGVKPVDKNGDDSGWMPDVVPFMMSILSNSPTQIERVDINRELMQCKVIIDGDDLSDRLVARGFACKLVDVINDVNVQLKLPTATNVFDVMVTHVEEPSLFYGQLATHENIQVVIDITNQLTERYKNTEALKHAPTINQVCAGFYEQYGECYRVRVQQVDQDRATVFLIDYGEVVVIPFTCLRELSIEHQSTNARAIPMTLAHVEPCDGKTWSGKAVEMLTNLITPCKKSTVEVVERFEEKISVKISFEGIDAAQFLVEKKLARREASVMEQQKQRPVSPDIKRTMIQDIPKVHVPNEGDVGIVHVDSLTSFYGQLADISSLQQLETLNDELTKDLLGKSSQHIPIEDEICAGFFAAFNEYYRVRVMKVNVIEETVEAQSIDYGNTAKFSLNDVNSLPSKFASFPAQAINFALNNIPSNISEGDCIRLFEEKTVNKFSKFCVVKKEENKIFIEMIIDETENVLDLFRNGGLITDAVAPLMSTIPKVTEIVNIASPFIPTESTFEVLVTSVQDPSFFHGQLATHENMQVVADITNQLTGRFQNTQAPKHAPVINQVCAGFYEQYGESYRVRIQQVDQDRATVFLIDYGEVVVIPFTCLRELPIEHQSANARAIPMTLAHVEPCDGKTWSGKAVEMLTNLTACKKSTVEVVERGEEKISVKISCEGIDAAKCLVENKLARREASVMEQQKQRPVSPDIKRTMIQDIPKVRVPNEGVVGIVHVDSLMSFYGQLADISSLQQLETLNANMTKDLLGKSSQHIPIEDEICAGFFATFNEYYRVRVMKVDIKKETVEAQSIDYGNTAKFSLNDVNSLPSKFASLPAQAINFALHNIPSNISEGDCIRLFEEKTVNKFSKFHVVKKEENKIFIEMIIDETENVLNLFKNGGIITDAVAPLMSTIPKVTEIVNIASPFIPTESTFEVLVTSVQDPSFFHGQLATHENMQVVVDITNQLTEHFQDTQAPNNIPVINQVCAGFYEQYGESYRVRIQQVDQDRATVFLIDYGEVVVIPFTCLRELPIEYQSANARAIPMTLADVEPCDGKTWSGKAVEMLTNLLTPCKKSTVEVVEIGEKNISVKISCDGIDAAQFLVEKKLARREASVIEQQKQRPVSPDIKRTMIQDIPKVHVPNEGDVGIVHVDSLTSFYGQLADISSLQQLETLNANMTKDLLGKSSQHIPIEDEICAGFFATFNEYYRVRVMKVDIKKETVEAQSIDYGNTATFSLNDVNSLPSKFASFPVQAINFALHNIPRNNSEGDCLRLFEEKTVNKFSKFRVVKKEENKLFIEMIIDETENVLDLFRSEGLITDAVAPLMSTIPKVTEIVNIASPFIPTESTFEVLVTSVQDPSFFHGQLATHENMQVVVDITNQLTERFQNTQAPKHTPVINQVCAGFYEQYGESYRVRVQQVGQDRATVFLIDYGEVVVIPFTCLRELPIEHQSSNTRAIPMTLAHVEPCDGKTWSGKAVEMLTNLLTPFKKSTVEVVERGEEKISVKISCEGIDAAQFLIENKLARREGSVIEQQKQRPVSPDIKRTMIQDIPKVHVPNEGDVGIVHVDSLTSFYGQLADISSLQQLETLNDNMTRDLLGKSSQHIPIEDEICAGFFAAFNEYYRVRVMKVDIKKETVEAQSIDYGNTATFSLNDVNSLPSKFASFPAQAINFALHNIPSNISESECIRLFEEKTVNKLSKYRTVKEEVNKCVVSLLVDGNEDINDVFMQTGYFHERSTESLQETPVKLEQSYELIQSQNSTSQSAGDDVTDSYTNLPHLHIPDAFEVLISHINDLNEFFVQVASLGVMETIQTWFEPMARYCNEHPDKSFIPTVNSLCFALSEDTWYRAYAVRIGTSTAKVYFIDFGNNSEVSFTSIRPFNDQFLNSPSLAVKCKLANLGGISPSSPRVVAEFERIALNELGFMKVVNRQTPGIIEINLFVNDEDVIEGLKVVSKDPKMVESVDSVEGMESLKIAESVNDQDLNNVMPFNGHDVMETLKNVKLALNAIESPKNVESLQSDSNVIERANPMSQSDAVTVPSTCITQVTTETYAPLNLPDKSVTPKVDIPAEEIYATVSNLPATVHPLDSVHMKMDIQELSNGTFDLQVTHVENPHMIYANVLDKQILDELKTISEELLTFFQHGLTVEEINLKAGIICAAYDIVEEMWRRAIITGVNPDGTSSVFFIDCGHTMLLSNTHLKPLLKQYKSLAAQAIPLKLITVKPLDDATTEWSSDTIQYLRSIITGQIVRVKPEFKESLLFGVRMKYAGQPLDKLLADNGHARKVEPELPQIGSLRRPPSKAIPFDRIANAIQFEKPPTSFFEALMSCIVSPRLFYCRLNDPFNLSKVVEFGSELEKLFGQKRNDEENVSADELCAVLTDGEWYRGFVLHIAANNNVDVFLLDHGFKVVVPNSDVRPLPDSMTKFPAQSLVMQLLNITPYLGAKYFDDESRRRFEELTIDRSLTVKVVKVHGHIFRVVLRDKETGIDIGNKLVQDGFASIITPQLGGVDHNGRASRGGFQNPRGRGLRRGSILTTSRRGRGSPTRGGKNFRDASLSGNSRFNDSSYSHSTESNSSNNNNDNIYFNNNNNRPHYHPQQHPAKTRGYNSDQHPTHRTRSPYTWIKGSPSTENSAEPTRNGNNFMGNMRGRSSNNRRVRGCRGRGVNSDRSAFTTNGTGRGSVSSNIKSMYPGSSSMHTDNSKNSKPVTYPPEYHHRQYESPYYGQQQTSSDEYPFSRKRNAKYENGVYPPPPVSNNRAVPPTHSGEVTGW